MILSDVLIPSLQNCKIPSVLVQVLHLWSWGHLVILGTDCMPHVVSVL